MPVAIELLAASASMLMRSGTILYTPDGPSTLELAAIGAALIGVHLAIRRQPRDESTRATIRFERVQPDSTENTRPTRGAA